MRVVRRTVYLAAVAAVLGSGLAACSSGTAGEGAAGTAPGSSAQRVAAVSRDVSFVADGTTTDGTLDMGWLIGVARHKALDRLRREAIRPLRCKRPTNPVPNRTLRRAPPTPSAYCRGRWPVCGHALGRGDPDRDGRVDRFDVLGHAGSPPAPLAAPARPVTAPQVPAAVSRSLETWGSTHHEAVVFAEMDVPPATGLGTVADGTSGGPLADAGC
jgi:hypothetical protein